MDLSSQLEDLTLNEVCELEESLDISISDIGEPGVRLGNVMRHLMWIVAQRDNPNVTLEEAGTATLGDLSSEAGEDEESPKAGK